MYSEQLENLISAALADGVLTDKERQVLLKRAVAEGVDPDEFEMVLDARIVELQKQQAAALAPPPPAPVASAPQPKSQKHGEVRKCPNCGAVVEAATAKCETCGYAFVGVEATSSVTKLAKKLNDIDYWYNKREREDEKMKRGRSALRNILSVYEQEPLDRQRAKAIKDFPIPNTREDLMEFVITMRAKWRNTSSEDHGEERAAYKGKYEECLQKVKFLFSDDPAFKSVFEQEKKDNALFSFIGDHKNDFIMGALILFCLIVGLLASLTK